MPVSGMMNTFRHLGFLRGSPLMTHLPLCIYVHPVSSVKGVQVGVVRTWTPMDR